MKEDTLITSLFMRKKVPELMCFQDKINEKLESGEWEVDSEDPFSLVKKEAEI